MQDNLSRQYLLYLRDMSRKVAAASAGDYSQVLVSGTRSKTANRFQRITDLHLADLANKGQQAYRLDRDQQKIGNGIFCGVGVLAGTYQKSGRSSNSLRIIASPLIYGQLLFEETGEVEISEWIVNYDLISALVSKNADEEEEAYASFNPEADVTANRLVQEVEDKLEDIDPSDLTGLNVLSETLLSGCKELTDTPCDRYELPLECAKAAVEARDNANAKRFFFCPGDWIYFAPIPPGISTYRALHELAKEVV